MWGAGCGTCAGTRRVDTLIRALDNAKPVCAIAIGGEGKDAITGLKGHDLILDRGLRRYGKVPYAVQLDSAGDPYRLGPVGGGHGRVSCNRGACATGR